MGKTRSAEHQENCTDRDATIGATFIGSFEQSESEVDKEEWSDDRNLAECPQQDGIHKSADRIVQMEPTARGAQQRKDQKKECQAVTVMRAI